MPKTKILLCSPWENCWLRYFKTYFGQKYDVKVYKYPRQVNGKNTEDVIDWADIVFFMWSDGFLKHCSEQKKKKGKKYIAYLRSYELWDTPYPWQINWPNIDHLIFVNDSIRKCFLANADSLNSAAGIKDGFKTPTHFIPNAIDLDEWKFVKRSPNKKIAWVNSLCYKKGVQLLAQFAFYMPYDYSIYPAGTKGDPRTGFYFDSITKAMRAENRIAPMKNYDDVQGFLADKSFSLNTSIVEGHPNAIIESMAVGIKPLIHNWPGAKDLFPENLIFNTIDEALEILEGDYDSFDYLNFVSKYDTSLIYPQIEELF